MSTSQSRWDATQLHAYVDGELEPALAARLEADCATDAALAARVAEQRRLRAQLHSHFDSVLDEPVPDRLLAALAGSTAPGAASPIGMARPQQHPRTRPAWRLREWSAMAASVMIGVLLGVVGLNRSSALPFEGAGAGLVASGYLDASLTSQIAAEAPGDAKVRVGMSFQSASSGYCRTFQLREGPAGVACRQQGRWRVTTLDGSASMDTGAPDAYRQAGSSMPPAVITTLESLGAGDPLTADEERRQRDQDWETSAAQAP